MQPGQTWYLWLACTRCPMSCSPPCITTTCVCCQLAGAKDWCDTWSWQSCTLLGIWLCSQYWVLDMFLSHFHILFTWAITTQLHSHNHYLDNSHAIQVKGPLDHILTADFSTDMTPTPNGVRLSQSRVTPALAPVTHASSPCCACCCCNHTHHAWSRHMVFPSYQLVARCSAIRIWIILNLLFFASIT